MQFCQRRSRHLPLSSQWGFIWIVLWSRSKANYYLKYMYVLLLKPLS